MFINQVKQRMEVKVAIQVLDKLKSELLLQALFMFVQVICLNKHAVIKTWMDLQSNKTNFDVVLNPVVAIRK